jgi:hypothetical protein
MRFVGFPHKLDRSAQSVNDPHNFLAIGHATQVIRVILGKEKFQIATFNGIAVGQKDLGVPDFYYCRGIRFPNHVKRFTGRRQFYVIGKNTNDVIDKLEKVSVERL